MGLMDKLKNLFTEEVEVEIEEPIKKEVMQVEIPAPVKKNTAETNVTSESSVASEPKKEEYQFPFFDDDDFHAMETKQEEPKKEKRSAYQRKAYKSENKEVYNPPKEEKKIFKPTPIISPVYGILDKNYQKEDLKTKNSKFRSYYNPKEATVDEIRNKAYGTLEDDIETTLFGRNKELYKEESVTTVDDDVDLTEDIMATTISDDFNDDFIAERPRHGRDDDLTDLIEAEMSKMPEEEYREEKPRKISDSELFSMIDSMYQKGDK